MAEEEVGREEKGGEQWGGSGVWGKKVVLDIGYDRHWALEGLGTGGRGWEEEHVKCSSKSSFI